MIPVFHRPEHHNYSRLNEIICPCIPGQPCFLAFYFRLPVFPRSLLKERFLTQIQMNPSGCIPLLSSGWLQRGYINGCLREFYLEQPLSKRICFLYRIHEQGSKPGLRYHHFHKPFSFASEHRCANSKPWRGG